MNPRLAKEIRPLLPAYAMMLAGMLLPFLLPLSRAERWMYPVLVWMVGSALLGVCAFAFEHQERTLALLLSQPVSRLRIWAEKYRVLLPMTLTPLAAIMLAWPYASFSDGEGNMLFAASFFASLASAPFWAGLTRSTLGAFAFSVTGQVVTFMVCLYLVEIARVFRDLEDVLPLAGLVYGGGLLVLGWRKFGETAGTQGAVPREQTDSRSSLQGAYGWLTPRCRPRGKWLNAVRRELCLQRSTFQLGALAFLMLLVMLAFDLSSNSRDTRDVLDILLIAPFLLATVGTALLAAPTALCEEKTLGTAVWNQTLPVSHRGQFFLKVFVAGGLFLFLSVLGPWVALQGYQALVPNALDGPLPWPLLRGIAAVLGTIFLFSIRVAAQAQNTLAAVLSTFTVSLVGLLPIYAGERMLLAAVDDLSDYEVLRGTLLWRIAGTETPLGSLPFLLSVATVGLVVLCVLWTASHDFGRVRPRGAAILTGISCVLLPTLTLMIVVFLNLTEKKVEQAWWHKHREFSQQFYFVLRKLDAGNPDRSAAGALPFTVEQFRSAASDSPAVLLPLIAAGQELQIRAQVDFRTVAATRGRPLIRHRIIVVEIKPALILEGDLGSDHKVSVLTFMMPP